MKCNSRLAKEVPAAPNTEALWYQ